MDPETMLPEAAARRAREIAAILGETAPEPIEQVERMLALGETEAVEAALAEALAIQARGGEVLPDGSRARTLGGIFFRLMRERLGEKAWQAIRPRTPPPPPRAAMDWDARSRVLSAIGEAKGRVMSATLMLTGRPGQVERQDSTVVIALAGGAVPPLPRGVPPPPAEPTTYVCYLDARQWAEIEQALKDPDDILIIEGHCAPDPATGTMAVYVQKATTRNLQRAQSRPRRGNAGRSPTRTAPRNPAPMAPRPTPVVPPAAPAPRATESQPETRFQKGMRVRHPELGEGDVIRAEPREGGEEAVTVDFVSVGLRRVQARASGLQIVTSASD